MITIDYRLLNFPCSSGAFSNVYKALDLGKGQKVACGYSSDKRFIIFILNPIIVKVVRKYELNASQVSGLNIMFLSFKI